jgi:hypothetical protein
MYKSVTDKMSNNSLENLTPEKKDRYMALFSKMRNNPESFTDAEQKEFKSLLLLVGGRSKQSRKRLTARRLRSSKRKVRKTRNTRRRY